MKWLLMAAWLGWTAAVVVFGAYQWVDARGCVASVETTQGLEAYREREGKPPLAPTDTFYIDEPEATHAACLQRMRLAASGTPLVVAVSCVGALLVWLAVYRET